MSVNKVLLLGRLGADPELKQAGESQVCNVSVATTYYAGKDRGEQTEWHRVQIWGKQAAYVAQYGQKGAWLHVEGRIRTRSFEQNGVTKYVTEVVAEQVQLVGGSRGSEGEGDFPA